jgi:hypothetical protein
MYVLDASDLSSIYLLGLSGGPCSIPSYRFQGPPISENTYNLLLPVSDNPYFLLFTVPYGVSSQSVKITVGPVLSVVSSAITTTLSLTGVIPFTRTQTVPITVTSSTVLEVPFIVAYGNWLVGSVLGTIAVIIALLFFVSRRKKKPRKRHR